MMLTAALAVPAVLGAVGVEVPEVAGDAAAGPEDCLIGYYHYHSGDTHYESCTVARPTLPS